MADNFEVQGFEEIAKKLENLGRKGKQIEDEAITKGADPILDDAKNTTAFKDRTGKLRKSLKKSKVKNSKEGKYVWVGDTDKEANYSWYVEFTNPFLRPAFEKNKDEVFEIIKNEMEKGLKNL
ncbi:MAG: phage protein Gp10 family [Anaerocolumna sp.]|jgi:HK97 gp10 family phage protein|nr:phage protein Gp10 family [Anaerocolumna sp.]